MCCVARRHAVCVSAERRTQGLRATAVRVYRHLGFLKFESCTISSAVPENPSLEPNMEWIGCTVCEIFAFKLYCDLETGVRGH